MNYFTTSASLMLLDEGGQINWTGWGFDVHQVGQAISKGYQQQDGEKLISMLPIADEELLRERLGELADSEDELGYYRIVPEAEAVAERDRLKAINDAADEVRKNTPTDDDIYKAQQLLLLTQIAVKLGGE